MSRGLFAPRFIDRARDSTLGSKHPAARVSTAISRIASWVARFAIALPAAGGVVIGSAGTYFLTKPLDAPTQSASPAAGGTPPAQSVTMPTIPPQQQFTPASQPPGEVPPGKVWSVEHGHWHDAPGALTPAPTPTTPGITPVPAPSTVPPVATTPAPAATPVEKKE